MRKHYLLGGLLFVSLLSSCKKELSVQTEDSNTIFPQTQNEKQRVDVIKEITTILKKIYKDPFVVYEVNSAIRSEYYLDERVLLKDLLTPEKSLLYQKQKFIASKSRKGLFKNAFVEELRKNNYPKLKSIIGEPPSQATRLTTEWPSIDTRHEIWTNEYGVSIYFPYSEDHSSINPLDATNNTVSGQLITIAPADREADSGPGYAPYFEPDPNISAQLDCQVDGICYLPVTVDDAYAETHPTHIVGVEAEESPTEPPPPPPSSPGVSRVYIGEGLCQDQYDRFISFTGNGGGSEIKYCHLTGYLQPVNGQVTTFQDIVSVNFTRKDIKKERWLRLFIVWDDDWVQPDLEQVLAIYEEDNTGTKTFNGSLGTTVTVTPGSTITGTIGYTVSVVTQDDIIRELKISRNSYFAGSFQNQAQDFSNDATFLPLPFTHGWPAYDVHYWNKTGATVGWTWPYNTF